MTTATASAVPSVSETAPPRLITIAEFLEMDFEFPVDLVRGRIEEMPPPAPAHGRVCMNIAFLLEQWTRLSNAGTVVCNDSAVVTNEVLDTVRGSDVAFIRWESLPNRLLPVKAFRVAPDLVVEVLPPSDRWPKVERKLDDYLGVGVKEVWVVSIEERVLWVCRPGDTRRQLAETDELASPELLPGFSCRVADFFLHV